MQPEDDVEARDETPETPASTPTDADARRQHERLPGSQELGRLVSVLNLSSPLPLPPPPPTSPLMTANNRRKRAANVAFEASVSARRTRFLSLDTKTESARLSTPPPTSAAAQRRREWAKKRRNSPHPRALLLSTKRLRVSDDADAEDDAATKANGKLSAQSTSLTATPQSSSSGSKLTMYDSGCGSSTPSSDHSMSQ